MSTITSKAFLAEIAGLAASFRARIEAEVTGFDPDPAACQQRRTQAWDDYDYFVSTYFPHYARSPHKSELHKYLFKRLPEIVASEKSETDAIAAPRGEAKSTLVSQLFVLWCLVTNRKRYPVIVMDSIDQAYPMLEAIKAELQFNPRLLMDFPEASGQGRVWQAGTIVTRGDAKVQVAGAGKKLRGLRHGPYRPDLVVLDDIENDEQVANPEQRDKRQAWISKTVLPLGGAGAKFDVVYIGTILHHDSVLSRTLANPLWRSARFKALLAWPDRMDMWETWEELLRNEGPANADLYYAAHQAEMDAGSVCSWAARPLLALMKIRARDGHDTPAKAARMLRDADAGNIVAQHQLFDDMLDRDSHLRCEWDKRCAAPTTLDWSIEPPANATAQEKASTAWVEEILRDVVDDFEDVLIAMQEAIGHGFSGIEMEWKRWGREWIPSFHPRPQTWFQLDSTRRHIRLQDGSADGAALLPMGWIFHSPRKVKTGYTSRAGLFRPAVWPFLYKAYSVGDFAEFLETYGLPIIVGKFPPGASDEEKASLFRAVTALGHDARAIMPEGMQLEIQAITGGAGGSHHLAMVDWADRAHSKLVLGQVLSAEAKSTGMGSGVADLQGEVRDDIKASDARQLAATLTRDLIYPMIVLNRGGIDGLRRCPRLVFDLGEAEDLKLYSEALPKLAENGARIPVPWVHEKLRIPEAQGDEPVFGRPPAAPPAPPAPSPIPPATLRAALAALAATRPPAPDGIDTLVDTALQDWQPVMQPLVDPIQAAMDASAKAGETAEQFLARLPALLTQMDVTELTAALAHAAFTARLGARAGLGDD